MSSATTSGQRKTLKALAQTPHELFDAEDAEVIVEKVVYRDAEKETKQAIETTNERGLSEDMSMTRDDEGFQCGHCGDYHGDWIQCENKACTIQWYGLECVGLDEAPAGRWICTMCRPRPVFPNLSGGPKGVIQVDTQPKSKGVAIKKRNLDKPKPKSGWKGWVEDPREMKEKMQQEVDAQWEVTPLAKRTRTNPEIYEGEQKRRHRRQKTRGDQSPPTAKYGEPHQTNIPRPREGDSQSLDDGHLTQEPAAASTDQGRSPPSEPLPKNDGVTDEEGEGMDEGISARYDRESTFEGFSDTERTDSIGFGLGETGVVDDEVVEAENLSPGDQSANEINDADGIQDFEIDDIESGLDEMSVVDEDEEAEDLLPGDQLGDEVSDVDDNQGVRSRRSAMEGFIEVDVGGGAPRETLGVGAMDYTYLDLYGYGPYLVRRS